MNIWHDINKERIKKMILYQLLKLVKTAEINMNQIKKREGLDQTDYYIHQHTILQIMDLFQETYAEDHDPLDVLVLCQEEIVPLTLVECYPVGVLIMTDNNEQDEKIAVICKQDPFLNCYQDISELPAQKSLEIKHFFEVYKQLEGKQTAVDKILGRKEAEEIIQKMYG